MFPKLNVILLTLCTASAATAQDSAIVAPFIISGSADVYYRNDFAATKGNNLSSFTNSHNSFELGMASVKLQYQSGKVKTVADLGVGKRALEFSYNDGSGILAAIKQLYISYSPATWANITAGSWATHVGYELVDAPLNRNYSMSYMFTNGPFFHAGVKAEAVFGTMGFMAGIANPTDFKYVPDGVMNKKAFLAQWSFAPGDFFKSYLNYVGATSLDTSSSRQVDLVITSKLSNSFNLGYNGTINRATRYIGNKRFDQTKSWWGSALYLNYDASDHFGLTLREEYFNDKNGLTYSTARSSGARVFATTLSANIKTAHLIFIPELRYDRASRPLFLDKQGGASSRAASILFAAIYQF